MIELIPAIDVIGGKCVRLTRGDYQTKREYGDPVEQAVAFERMGFRRLHVVDLDGARGESLANIGTLEAIASRTSLTVDFGGGIRTSRAIEGAFSAGAAMVTIGSVAVTDPGLYLSWLGKYGPERLILGADARDGMVSINGWETDSRVDLMDFIGGHMRAGTRNVLCTDIGHDGTLGGPSTALYAGIMKAFPHCHLIASGGVRDTGDIDALEAAGVPAVVFGKSVYEGTMDMDELSGRCLPRG